MNHKFLSSSYFSVETRRILFAFLFMLYVIQWSKKERGGIPVQYYTIQTQLPLYIPYARFLLDLPLSETAKLVYSLILSRIQLSKNNGWIDEEKRVYCRYTIQELMADSGKGKSTIVTALADLEAQGLLYRYRSGAGYANKLYLRLPESGTLEDRKTKPQRTGKPAPNKYNKIINYEYTGDSL